MPNDTGIVNNGRVIAQRSLELLLKAFPSLRQFCNDYSDATLKVGESVKVKRIGSFVAKTFDKTKGYGGDASDINADEISVTLNKHAHVTVGLDDIERSSTDLDFITMTAAPRAHAIAKPIFDDLFALVTVANFANESVIALADYDRAAAADVAMALSTRDIPDFRRICLLGHGYANALEKDFQIVGNTNPDNAIVVDGRLPGVSGLSHSKYGGIPANNQNLAGFAAHPDALAIAARLPKSPRSELVGGIIEAVTNPASGMSVQLRQYYDMNFGKEFTTLTMLYGVGLGEGKAGQRLVTQANA